jgi:hypothetical protein
MASPASVLTLVVFMFIFINSMKECSVYQPFKAQPRSGGTSLDQAPRQPASAQWATQSDFLLHCSDLAQDAVPADHPSKLAPLLAHPADVPISDDALASELTAAIAGTEAVKSGAASATSMNCLRDPLYEMLPLGSKPKIGEQGPLSLLCRQSLVLHQLHASTSCCHDLHMATVAAIVVGYNAPKGSTNQDNMYARSLRDKREYAAKHGYDVVVYGNTTILEGRYWLTYSRLTYLFEQNLNNFLNRHQSLFLSTFV